MIGVRRVYVINWVKQFVSKFKNIPKKCEDKMCISSKKNMTLAAVNRKTKSFENLCENITHGDARFYATDQYSVYDIIPRYKRFAGRDKYIPLKE